MAFDRGLASFQEPVTVTKQQMTMVFERVVKPQKPTPKTTVKPQKHGQTTKNHGQTKKQSNHGQTTTTLSKNGDPWFFNFGVCCRRVLSACVLCDVVMLAVATLGGTSCEMVRFVFPLPKPKCNKRFVRQYPEFSLTLPFSGCVHHLSSPSTLSLSTFKITGGCKCTCPSFHIHCACSTHKHTRHPQAHTHTQTHRHTDTTTQRHNDTQTHRHDFRRGGRREG